MVVIHGESKIYLVWKLAYLTSEMYENEKYFK